MKYRPIVDEEKMDRSSGAERLQRAKDNLHASRLRLYELEGDIRELQEMFTTQQVLVDKEEEIFEALRKKAMDI